MKIFNKAALILLFSVFTLQSFCVDLKQEMVSFVMKLSSIAKKINKNFQIVPNLGSATILVSSCSSFTNAIDGCLKESLYYTAPNDETVTWNSDDLKFLKNANKCGKKVLIIDFCKKSTNKKKSYDNSKANSFISFQSDFNKYFFEIQSQINDQNLANITKIQNAKNFIVFYDYDRSRLKNTNYDLLIVEAFLSGKTLFDPAPLKKKANYGKRLVLGYLNVAELTDYMYYYNETLQYRDTSVPKDKTYNYYTMKFWMSGWQDKISEALKFIINKGYDGVMLDRLDSYCDKRRPNSPSCYA